MTKMYAYPLSEGISLKGTYVFRMDGARENDLSLSPGGNSLCEGGLALYISI